MRVVVETDGGSRGNPGPAGYGAVVRDEATGVVLAERKEAIGTDTNNVAEYRGLICGLQAAAELGATRVIVRMDSKLVVEQMSGRWQVKNDSVRRLAREANDLRTRFDDVRFEWVPRDQNRHADRLANEAMDAAAQLTSQSPRPSWTLPTGTPTRLILARHAPTAHNAERRFSGRNDLPLTSAGERQAARLAARVASSFGAVDAVVTSTLRRARQTAAAIGSALRLDVGQLEGLVEQDFGSWEGKTLDEVRALWPDELDAWLAYPDAAPRGGESFADVERRVRRARNDLISAHLGGIVVVVTHVTPIKTLLRLALEAPPETMYRIHLDPASISIADYYADGQTSVRLVNDTGHLEPA